MNVNHILVTGHMYKEIEHALEVKKLNKEIKCVPEEEISDQLMDWADVLVSFRPPTNVDLTRVKWVHSLGAGVDPFVFRREWDKNVLLTRTICTFGERIGQYCLSYILQDLQYHNEFRQYQQAKEWIKATPPLLSEQKALIFGTGVIGHETGKLLSNLGVKVFGVSLSGSPKESFEKVITTDTDIRSIGNVDYIINTLPLTEGTYKMFNSDFFSNFSNAFFINVGRGASVDESALINALDNKEVRHAVLDVFSEEPLPETSILWGREDIQITPHISAVTDPEEAIDCFLQTLEKVEKGLPLVNKVGTEKEY